MGDSHVTIIGHYDPEYRAHEMLREAIIHSERELGRIVNTRWISPNELGEDEDALCGTRAIIIAPRNPKAPRQLWPEILSALAWARNSRVPTLGIEYGYQHMVIDLARNVLGHPDANSLAYDESVSYPVIAPLTLDEPPIDKFKPRVIDVEIDADSRLAELYGQSGGVRESFRGHYVFNPDYAGEFEKAGMRLSSRGRLGERQFIAGLEWNAHPFWIGVAWLPQFASTRERSHPVVRGLVLAGLTE